MTAILLSAFVLGLVFNAAPGAVFAETVRQGVRGGFAPAFAVQVGSLAGDALWALAGLAGAGLLLQLEAVRFPVAVAGALYLVWLARDAWRAAGREFALDVRGDATNACRAPRAAHAGALRAGVLLSLFNPQNIAYWAAVGGALSALGVHAPDLRHYAAYFAGFMAASVLWCFVCAALVDRMFRAVGARWARVTYRAVALALFALALASLRDLLRHEFLGHEAGTARPAPAAVHGGPGRP